MNEQLNDKISKLGYTGKKLVKRGVLEIIVGIVLMFLGSLAPRIAIQCFLGWIFFSSVWSLLSRWFRRGVEHENLLITIIKIVLSLVLSEWTFFENATIYLIVFSIGIYQLFMAMINIVTYVLYKQNNIKPRFKYLFDGILLAMFGLSGVLPTEVLDNEIQLLILGFYVLTLGMTTLRDGIFFENEDKSQLKRRVRVTMPLFLAALIPAATLKKVNDYLQDEHSSKSSSQAYNQVKENKDAELEVFVHTSEANIFGAIGHVDICYDGKVISYGSYDPNSERLFGTVGDGVLFKVDREKYIEFCQKESQKTLFGYGIDLTPEQEEAVKKHISNLESLTVEWDPEQYKVDKKTGEKTEMYAYKLKKKTGAELFKFTSSKFKSYFVLSTNCVLLADSIIGQAGTDVLSAKGFISPGTYQDYLNKEFEKPNSIVVSKSVYKIEQSAE